jgi:hypothetical protein
MIAIQYLTGDFAIDFLSTIPFVDLATGAGMKDKTGVALLSLLKLLKVLRIRKISVMIRNLNASLETKTYYKICQVILQLVIFFHVIGCMLWLIFKNAGVWWPPLDFAFYGFKDAYLLDEDDPDWDYFKDVHKQSWVRKYCVAIYTSAL